MSSLINAITKQLSEQVVGSIAREAKIDKKSTKKTLAASLPTIIEALNANASTKTGAKSLSKALEKNHSNVSYSELIKVLTSKDIQKDGGKILGHILGGNKSKVASKLGKNVGIDSKTTMKILSMVAPLILANLGKKQKYGKVNLDNLSSVLGAESKKSTKSTLLKSFLDKDDDGSIVDDLLQMVTK